MSNNPIFQQFNGMQNRNVNPAMYKVQLQNKLKEMQANGVNPDKEINQGLSNGELNQQQVDLAYGIAANIAKNLFGIK